MILLTGAAGYIGSHVYHELKRRRIKVIGIDNLSTNNVKNRKIIIQVNVSTGKLKLDIQKQ